MKEWKKEPEDSTHFIILGPATHFRGIYKLHTEMEVLFCFEMTTLSFDNGSSTAAGHRFTLSCHKNVITVWTLKARWVASVPKIPILLKTPSFPKKMALFCFGIIFFVKQSLFAFGGSLIFLPPA